VSVEHGYYLRPMGKCNESAMALNKGPFFGVAFLLCASPGCKFSPETGLFCCRYPAVMKHFLNCFDCAKLLMSISTHRLQVYQCRTHPLSQPLAIEFGVRRVAISLRKD
jgi:hypothetical protein